MTKRANQITSNVQGFALAVAVLVMLGVSLIAVTAVSIGSTDMLLTRFYEREEQLGRVADGGVEYARALINGDKDLYPDEGYNTLISGGEVVDGDGNTVPGVTRSLYVGPTGITSGQYGIFGTVVSVVEDEGGGISVRRGTVYQESFAKFAYFTDYEPSNIRFGNTDQIFGPLHSNSPIRIYAPQGNNYATFHGEVTTASDVPNPSYGKFVQGYEEYVPNIPMPVTADLDRLKAQANKGGTAFSTTTPSSDGDVNMRFDFVAIDLNGDGDTTDPDEGFFRVYESTDADWVSGNVPEIQTCTTDWRGRVRCRTEETIEGSDHCGDFHSGQFLSSADHDPGVTHNQNAALNSASKQCFLGGDPQITNGFVATDARGGYVKWTGNVDSRLAGRADREYLFPLSRALNPNFKGVLFVDGSIGVSGIIRGQITVAATGDVVFLDDTMYATNPAAGTCVDNAGYFAGDDVVVADNALNAPVALSGNAYKTFDDTSDEFFHGVVLALDIFTVDNYNSGSNNAQPCEGRNTGRGCLYLTGGIIQDTRGAVGLTSGQGYSKRYAYDPCAATNPPPYFPTTGRFAKGQQFYVDPTGFDVSKFYALLTPRN